LSAPQELIDLIQHYQNNRDTFLNSSYNETQTRIELIDPLFELIGWDMSNSQGFSEEYKEVVHEDRVRIEGKMKAPDYAFRIGGIRKFQLEAKKPSVNIKNDNSAALQIRRYAWSASLDLCVLTNFEFLAIYDSGIRPDKGDTARKGRAKIYNFSQFEENWEEICDLLSPVGIQKGNFAKFAAGAKSRRGSTTIDSEFLDEIEEWRRSLALDIADKNPKLSSRDLNRSVQLLIDRIVFLRIAEDRGIEKYGRLKEATEKLKIYDELIQLFKRADRRYNSGLFHLVPQNKSDDLVDKLSQSIIVSDNTLKPILDNLYYPESPYEFSEMPADVLGQVYERFLGKVITLKDGVASVDLKPEVKKAGGVYYTPSYIVRYLINATVGADLEKSKVTDISGKSKKAYAPYRVVDPACGSGSFLIEVYQKLLNWYLEQYKLSEKTYSKGKSATIYNSGGKWKLRISERKRILLDHIYGVDIDPQAVEVTKLSLLLKVLEGESSDEIARQMDLFKDRVLPDLGENIQCGNSLIGIEYGALYPKDMLDDDIAYSVNAFDWKERFPNVFKTNGFDAVVGNPPYFSIDKTWGAGDHKSGALKALYPNIHTDKTDIYYYFLAKGLQITQGSLGFIVSRAFLEAVKAEKVRGYLSSNSGIVEIFDFQNYQVFEGVGITTAMIVLSKHLRPRNTHVVKVRRQLEENEKNEKFLAKNKSLTRFSVSRKSLAAKPWRLSSAKISKVFEKIDKAGQPLSRICKLGQGMQTGLNSVFGKLSQSDVDAIKAPNKLLKYRARNTDIQRYNIRERNELMLYLEDVEKFASLPSGVQKHLNASRKELKERAAFKRDNCEWWKYSWPLQKDLYGGPRILCPYLATENRFAIDNNFDFLGLTDTTVIFPTNHKEDIAYLCALLNSRLLSLRFKGIGKLKSNGILEYFDNSVSQLPIRMIDWKNKSDVSVHGKIIELHDVIADLSSQLSEPLAATVARNLEAELAKKDLSLEKLICSLYGFTIEELEAAEVLIG